MELLQAAATKYGMWHGPFTHSALASGFLALDAHVDTGEAEWNALMKNDSETVNLICRRMIADWEAAPPGRLRKSATSDDVKSLHIACRGFLVMKKEVQQIVGDSAWAAHEAEVTAKFFSKALDCQISKVLEGWPLKQGKAFVDLSEIPSMTAVVTQNNKMLEDAAKKKTEELTAKVESATYEQLCESLKQDAAKLKNFFSELAKRKNEWSDIVVNHRRKRYHQGRGL